MKIQSKDHFYSFPLGPSNKKKISPLVSETHTYQNNEAFELSHHQHEFQGDLSPYIEQEAKKNKTKMVHLLSTLLELLNDDTEILPEAMKNLNHWLTSIQWFIEQNTYIELPIKKISLKLIQCILNKNQKISFQWEAQDEAFLLNWIEIHQNEFLKKHLTETESLKELENLHPIQNIQKEDPLKALSLQLLA